MNDTLYKPEWLRGWTKLYEPKGGAAGAAGGAAAWGASGTGVSGSGTSDAAAGANDGGNTDRRIVFLCFMQGGPIVIQRLMEACHERGAGAGSNPLAGVCVLCLPLGDDIARAGGEHN